MTQSVKVWIDKNFLATKGAGEILTTLEKSNFTSIVEALPVENSIFWTRNDSVVGKEIRFNEVQHDHILVKIEIDLFVEHLTDFNLNEEKNTLKDFIFQIKNKAQVSQATLLIQNFKHYLKGASKNKSESKESENYNDFVKKKTKPKTNNANLTKTEINNALIYLELNENVCVRSYESNEELRDLISCYSKSVLEYLVKVDMSENMLFCEKSVEKSQTKVSKEGQGLLNLWKDILECFPLVSCDQAQAICAMYSSPLVLKNEYEKSPNPGMMLADIQVRRGAGVLSSVRKIGPELSQKIHKFFTSNNFKELLVNE